MSLLISFLLGLFCMGVACSTADPQIRSGAERLDYYLPLIRDKQFALVANHTSVVGGTHLVDTLLSRGLGKDQLLKVFAPEHGFRGDQAAGDQVDDGSDPLTGIPIVSLYGTHHKPEPQDLEAEHQSLPALAGMRTGLCSRPVHAKRHQGRRRPDASAGHGDQEYV